jgi:rubrerythrin
MLFLSAIVLFAGIIMSCKQAKPVKTIENLKAAYNGESTASAKYAQFALKARDEGFNNIAKMFEATSKAEAIHADNHKKVLEKLGEKVETPVIGEYKVLTTLENLADAMKGESYEVETMYPDFMNTAETENCIDAKKSFTWAIDTEKKHKEFYQSASSALSGGSEQQFPAGWYVCPVCGNTYDEGTVKEACDFCQTNKAKFIVF